jgi:hypothetical protein
MLLYVFANTQGAASLTRRVTNLQFSARLGSHALRTHHIKLFATCKKPAVGVRVFSVRGLSATYSCVHALLIIYADYKTL